MAKATARVAGLRTARAVGGVAATVVATALGAVAGNVADLAALVALLAAATSTATVAGTTTLGALARQVAGLAAAVAGALLGRLGALAVCGVDGLVTLDDDDEAHGAKSIVWLLLTDVALTTAVVATRESKLVGDSPNHVGGED